MLVITYNCSLHVFSRSSQSTENHHLPPPHPIYFHADHLYVQKKMATAKCDTFVDLITQRASVNYLVFKIVHTHRRPDTHSRAGCG